MERRHPCSIILILLVTAGWSCSAHGQRSSDPLTAGQDAETSGQYDQAIQQYQEAIRLQPRQVEASLGLSRTYRTTGRYDDADVQARRAVEIDPAAADAHQAVGELLAFRGRYAEAEASLQRALSSPGVRPRARLDLGLMYEETGRKADAQRLFEDLVQLYRTGGVRDGDGVAAVAVAAQHLGMFYDANDLFAEATRLDPRHVEAYVAWGYLFLTKYNRRDAAGVFQDALKINPSSPAALVGLAECQMEDRGSQAEAGCQKALTINPKLVEARRLLARLYLIDEQYVEAVAQLKQALEVNPSSPMTRSLLAACYQAMRDAAGFQAECQRVLAVNPSYGELYATIAENLARRYRFHEAIEMDRKAIQLDPELWTAYANLGINLSRVGQEEEGRQYLDRAFEHDSFNIWTHNTLNLFDSFKDCATRQSQHFILKMHKDEDPVYGSLAIDLLEEAYRTVSPRYEFEPRMPILVELFPKHDDFAVRISGLTGAGALLGVCFGEVIVANSPRARQGGMFNWGQTLWHEFAHVLHLQLTRNRVPRWLAEGIAVYEARRARPEWDLDLAPEFATAVERNQLLRVSDLNSGFTRPKTMDQVVLSYYQASIVVEYIVQQHGFDALLKMLRLYGEDRTTEEAVRAVLNVSLQAFDEGFLAYAKQRTASDRAALQFSPKNRKELSESDLREEVERRPGSFHAHLLLGQLLLARGDEDEAIQHLSRARDLMPKYVHGENPYRLLATLYRKRGDEAAAIRELEALAAIDEDNLDANKELARLYAGRKQDADVIRVLARAAMINPFDPDVRNGLGAAYEAKRLFGLAITEYKAALGIETTDRAGAYCNLARAYLLAGLKADAKREALHALEIAPNYEAAQRILLSAVE